MSRQRSSKRSGAGSDRPARDVPSIETVVVATLAATVAATATFAGDPTGGVVAFVGVGAFGFGIYRGRNGVVRLGGVALVVGVLVAGVYGAGAVATLLGVAALAVAWELARHGLSAAAHVGSRGVTRRSVAARTGIVGVAVGVATAFVYGVYAVGTTGRPLGAVVLLVVGATLVGTAATARER